jgi:hypothetical protein
MSFLPPDFDGPELLETDRFRIRPLTIHDVVKDYDAVMTSREHLYQGCLGLAGELCWEEYDALPTADRQTECLLAEPPREAASRCSARRPVQQEDCGSPHPCGTYGGARPAKMRDSTALDRRSLIRMRALVKSSQAHRTASDQRKCWSLRLDVQPNLVGPFGMRSWGRFVL